MTIKYYRKQYDLDVNLHKLLMQLPGLVAFKSPDIKLCFLNKCYMSLLNIRCESEYIGKTLDETNSSIANLSETFETQDKLVLSERLPHKYLNIMRLQKKQLTYMITNKIPYYDSNNQVIGLLERSTILTNVTLNNIMRLISPYNSIPNHTQQSYSIIEEGNYLEITTREHECIYYLIRGASAKNIALILNVSFRTVETHIRNLKFKLKCSTKQELIKIALNRGYLYSIPESIFETNGITYALNEYGG